MKLIYKNKKTEEICEDYKVAARKLGIDVARKLMLLVEYLKSAECLAESLELIQYRLHALSGNRKYQYSFVIHKGSKWRLIIYPLDVNEKLLTDKTNEREMLLKAVIIEILEVSEHYD